MKKFIYGAVSALILSACAGTPAGPKEIAKEFLQALQDGNCGNAKSLCVGDAVDRVESIQDAGCDDVKYDLTTLSCKEEEDVATCDCKQRDTGNEDKVYLKKKDEKWVIEDFDGGFSVIPPEEVVRNFVIALANGDCDDVMELSIGDAKESVQGSIDAGCESYDTELVSVSCETQGDRSKCECKETRTGMDMLFNYELEQKDGSWKVASYQKDLGMDLDME